MHVTAEKHKMILKKCTLKCAMIYVQQHNQNVLNFKQHFTLFTDKTLYKSTFYVCFTIEKGIKR